MFAYVRDYKYHNALRILELRERSIIFLHIPPNGTLHYISLQVVSNRRVLRQDFVVDDVTVT